MPTKFCIFKPWFHIHSFMLQGSIPLHQCLIQRLIMCGVRLFLERCALRYELNEITREKNNFLLRFFRKWFISFYHMIIQRRFMVKCGKEHETLWSRRLRGPWCWVFFYRVLFQSGRHHQMRYQRHIKHFFKKWLKWWKAEQQRSNW